MSHRRRVGRPRKRLPDASHPITERVRYLVETAHAGNLNEASRVTGLAYPTLRDLYVGETVHPGLSTLNALRAPYDLELEWFAGGERVPMPLLPGVVGLVPAVGNPGDQGRREVLIPFRAWPMYQVFRNLGSHLRSQPRAKQRPIVGKAKGEKFTLRLTSFLLAPLLAAEEMGVPGTIVTLDKFRSQEPKARPSQERWIRCLRSLGETWETALSELSQPAAH